MISSNFFDSVQKACLPGIWSKGVNLARSDLILSDSVNAEELIFKIRSKDHPVSRKVTLWPEDEDWYCDCGDKNSVCAHVAAVVIALKSGKLKSQPSEVTISDSPHVVYRFTSRSEELHLDRWIMYSSKNETLLTNTLVSFVSGVSSGRLSTPPIVATKEDYAVDYALSHRKKETIDYSTWTQLFKILSDCRHVFLDGLSIKISSIPLQFKVQLVDEGSGFRLRSSQETSISQIFKNGAALCGNTLKAFEFPDLSIRERDLLLGAGTYFSSREAAGLVTEVLPYLKKKMTVEIVSQRLPKVKIIPPKVIIRTSKTPDNKYLIVTPCLVYEGPNRDSTDIFLPDPHLEKLLTRQLQNELQLNPGQTVQLEGETAVDFVIRLKNWENSGDGIEAFSLSESITPVIQDNQKGFDISFETSRGQAQATQVFQAWKNHQNYVPLLNGGWAPLPKNWLEKFGNRISALLESKTEANELPKYLTPELIEIYEELNHPYSDALKDFRKKLNNIGEIPPATLPEDLTATLRHYQRDGINWLNFLRNTKMGAMLADDMGLGKTLQSLCAIQGRTLIVSPTSVLPSWKQQISQFRPNLLCSIYHGSSRKIDPTSHITLTTYAILRLDRELITNHVWDTIILDEAQMIKNPQSQVAQVAHSLKAEFKIALSGTPVENRLDDLWSQFHFLNPGLLGTYESFQEQFVQPISKGNIDTTLHLKSKIKPFILRRLKRDVAPELPLRTEKVLYCELNEEERSTYEAILASTRKEVLSKLEVENNVFAALELLLRLRQACCHISLIPGQKSIYSSKVSLLIQTLEDSIALGHKALIFSQWTSYLDLIEPSLRDHGISFLRLDGTTKNREQVIEEFQTQSSSQVMLLSLKAGGVGITLTAADHIFFMDPWWNPAIENQAADRAHRIGQRNPVLIHRIVAQDTVEEKILNLQKAKSNLAAAILQESGQSAEITRDDLLRLLSDEEA
jgi:superfamily II DNA or RNA helicase